MNDEIEKIESNEVLPEKSEIDQTKSINNFVNKSDKKKPLRLIENIFKVSSESKKKRYNSMRTNRSELMETDIQKR